MNAAPVRSVYPQQPRHLLGDRVATARGYGPVILSLQNNLAETQAQSRLSVLRPAFQGSVGVTRKAHRAYCPGTPFSLASIACSSSIFGGSLLNTAARRMFTTLPACQGAWSLDTSPNQSFNAKQEGIP